MKTMAQLKRDAKSGQLEAMMTYNATFRDGLPERLQGWRKIIDCNTVSIFFDGGNGKKSQLELESANLVEYDDNSLTIYFAGLREPTKEEKAALDEWNEIEKGFSPYEETFWKRERFFVERGLKYLLGYSEFVRGKRYDYNTGKIYDRAVKGDVCIRYELRNAQ